MRGEDVFFVVAMRWFSDHPRMRGEDNLEEFLVVVDGGSPPHARGRHPISIAIGECDGITPACAGKTRDAIHWTMRWPDHPRMRGEDVGRQRRPKRLPGSPPHARGRLLTVYPTGEFGGDHPRMRGEDSARPAGKLRGLGSPPHARGRLRHALPHLATLGITPACAGKTFQLDQWQAGDRDHPRMRGEDWIESP